MKCCSAREANLCIISYWLNCVTWLYHSPKITLWRMIRWWTSGRVDQNSIKLIPLSPFDSIRLATLHVSPHKSYTIFKFPITPATTGPLAKNWAFSKDCCARKLFWGCSLLNLIRVQRSWGCAHRYEDVEVAQRATNLNLKCSRESEGA